MLSNSVAYIYMSGNTSSERGAMYEERLSVKRDVIMSSLVECQVACLTLVHSDICVIAAVGLLSLQLKHGAG